MRVPRSALRGFLALAGWLVVGVAYADPPPPSADDARARELRRIELLERARAAVRPEDAAAGGMDDIEAVLEAEGEAWHAVAPDAVDRARQLVGTVARPGLVRQGAILFRWVVQGQGLPYLRLVGADVARKELARIDPRQLDDLADASNTPDEPRPEVLKLLLTADVDVARRRDGQVEVHAPTPPDAPADLAPVDAVPSLRAAAGGYPYPRPNDGTRGGPSARGPLLAEELTHPTSQAWLRLKRIQTAERRRVWGAERPSRGLENDERVQRKQERVKRLRDQIDALVARRDAVLAGLDQMVEVERDLVTQDGVRAFEMEESESRDRSASEAIALERLRIEQWVDQQELRLLYITARRANERLTILDEAIVLVREEARIAGDVLASFVEELNRMRRERQLGRLQAQAFELRREGADAARRAAASANQSAVAWAARGRVVESLLEQNALLRELVALRQEIEALMQGPRAEEAPAGSAEAEAGASTDPTASALGLLANTTAITLGPKQVALAMEHLPALPADTVTSLFDAADERLAKLREARAVEQRLEDLDRRWGVQSGRTDEAWRALESASRSTPERALHGSVMRRWRRDAVEPNQAAFERAKEGVQQQTVLAAERTRHLRALRDALERQGVRSLGIRVERSLTGEGLKAAWRDVRAATSRGIDFVTFRGERHLGTFVVAHRNGVLATLGLIVACLVAVRFGHRAIDRWLDRKAGTNPALRRIGLSPIEETAAVKAEQQRVDAEREAVAAEEMKKASGQDAARPATTIEGPLESSPSAPDTGDRS